MAASGHEDTAELHHRTDGGFIRARTAARVYRLPGGAGTKQRPIARRRVRGAAGLQVAVDGAGNIFVADDFTKTLYRFNPNAPCVEAPAAVVTTPNFTG
jgi:hypothetical protein